MISLFLLTVDALTNLTFVVFRLHTVSGTRISVGSSTSKSPDETEVIVYANNEEAAKCAKNVVNKIAELILSRDIANERGGVNAGKMSKKDSANDDTDASDSGDAGEKGRNSKSSRGVGGQYVGRVNLLFVIPTNDAGHLFGPDGIFLQRIENG